MDLNKPQPFKAKDFSGRWTFSDVPEWARRVEDYQREVDKLKVRLKSAATLKKHGRLGLRIRNCESRIVALKLTHL